MTKDRKRRLHDIADARIELETALVDPTSSSLGLAVAVLDAPRRRSTWPWAAVLVAVFTAIGAGAAWMLKPAPVSRVVRLTMSIPPQYTLSRWPYPTCSPDGTFTVFRAKSSTGTSAVLIVRTLDQQGFRELPGTNRATRPFFSPDGEWLAFYQDRKLKKISMRGGSPISLCDAPSMRGGTWLDDGSIIFAPENKGGLMRVSASGGIPKPFTVTDDANEFASHRMPYALPNGRGVLFTSARDFAAWDMVSIMVVSGAGGSPKELIKSGSGGQYVSPGFVVFVREGTLMAARFDLNNLELTGQPVPVVEGVASGAGQPAQFTIDDHGTLMYMTDSGETKKRLVLIDRTGKEETVGKQTGDFGSARLSPDGRYVVLVVGYKADKRIGILERERDILRTLPSSARDSYPIWSPDGKWIVFASLRHGLEPNLYRVRADLSGKVERLTESERLQAPMDWAPDGSSLLFVEVAPTTDGDIHLLRFDEQDNVDGEPEALVEAPKWQWNPRYSPDGMWIGYMSVESGRAEILVRPSDGSGSAVQVSTAGAIARRWSPTEDVIYYLSADADGITMNSVKYTVADGVLTPLTPEVVFTLADRSRYDSSFDVTRDGKGFLFLTAVDAASTKIRREPTVVLNWTKELEALVPAE